MYLIEMQSFMNSVQLKEKGEETHLYSRDNQKNYDQAHINASAKEHIHGTSQ